MRKLRYILCIFLCFTMFLCGCKQNIVITTGFKDGELIKISSNPVKLSEAMIIFLGDLQSYEVGFDEEFWNIKYKDKTMYEFFKEEVKEEFIRINVLSEYAKKENVTLSEDEEVVIDNAVNLYMDQANEKLIEKYNITKSDVKSLLKKIVLSDKVYEKVMNGYEIEISDEEARVMYVNYIYLDASATKAMDIANEIYGKVSLGSDMKAVAEKYDYATFSEGYITRMNFDESQSNEIFKLKDNQVSSVIESNGKIYIFKCINDYEETMTLSNKELLIEQKREEEFDKDYKPFENSINVEFNTDLWNQIEVFGESTIDANIYDVLEKAGQP